MAVSLDGVLAPMIDGARRDKREATAARGHAFDTSHLGGDLRSNPHGWAHAFIQAAAAIGSRATMFGHPIATRLKAKICLQRADSSAWTIRRTESGPATSRSTRCAGFSASSRRPGAFRAAAS